MPNCCRTWWIWSNSIALLHKMSVLVYGEKEEKFSLEERWLPKCLAVATQGSVFPFSFTFMTCSEDLFLEKNKHLVLLLAGTESVLNSIE